MNPEEFKDWLKSGLDELVQEGRRHFGENWPKVLESLRQKLGHPLLQPAPADAPCPHCGGKARVRTGRKIGDSYEQRLECPACGEKLGKKIIPAKEVTPRRRKKRL